jgi:beta-ureidopropionase
MSTLARIATICQAEKFYPTQAENRSHMLSLLDLALIQQPDLVCLPEAFASAGVPQAHIQQVAESLPGPTTDAAAQRARQGGCYVVCPVVTQREGLYWNSAVMIGRDGSILGVYDKLHPVTSSPDYTVFEAGTMPGRQAPVFDLDFGRVGIQICFDIQFPEGWDSLAEQGARLVVWSSAYNGGFPLQAYAWRHHYYVVSAVQTERARIIDPCGAVLAQTDSLMNIAVREVNLDYAVCHTDFNYDIPDRLAERYPGRVAVRVHPDEGHMLIEPREADLTIAQLKQELGFICVDEYNQYHQQAFDRLHAGQAPIPQAALHGERPMYAKMGR